jgi:hypothetical protein
MIKDELDTITESFVNQLKTSWQIFFAIILVSYSISLWHFFEVKLEIRLLRYVGILDNISFVIATILAVIIFNLKRKYFSKKYSRLITETELRKDREVSEKDILKEIFKRLQSKLYLIWALGLLIVIDGVILYWITHLDRNMHIYFVIGSFSLFLNYPRKVLFEEMPWQIHETKKELLKAS